MPASPAVIARAPPDGPADDLSGVAPRVAGDPLAAGDPGAAGDAGAAEPSSWMTYA
jgi:hypothetical protein